MAFQANTTKKIKVIKTTINLGLRPYFVGDREAPSTDTQGVRGIAYHTDRIIESFPLIYALDQVQLCCELNLFLIHRYLGEFSKSRKKKSEWGARGQWLSLKTISSLAENLLPFVRWLEGENADWQEVIAEPVSNTDSALEVVPIWRYRNSVYTQVETGKLAWSTGCNRVNSVTQFYEWSYKNKRISILPFEIREKIIKKKRKDGGFDMLFGMSKYRDKGIPVFTTNMALPKSIKQKKSSPDDILSPYSAKELALLIGTDTVQSNLTYFLWVKLGYMVGLREFECVMIDRDFVKNPNTDHSLGWYLSFVGKGNKPRTVFVTRDLMADMWVYINTEDYARRVNKFQTKHGSEIPVPLFICDRGKNSGNRMSESSPGKIIQYVRNELEAKGLQRLNRTFHDLRATFATNLTSYLIQSGKQEGFIKYKLMSLLGHSSFSTTQKYLNFARNEGFEKTMMSWVKEVYGVSSKVHEEEV